MTITYPGQTEPQDCDLATLCQQSPYTVLYFYPKVDTPGCTLEAQGFSQALSDFQEAHCQVIGISHDPHSAHVKFCKKHQLTLPLISDTDLELHQDKRFQTRIQKSMYGKTYMGTERATFILDQSAQVIQAWRNVSVSKHVQEVLAFVQTLS